MDQFTGFPPDAFTLLAQIGAGDKSFFAEHRQRYHDEILDPTRLLVSALTDELHEGISAGLQIVPKINGSISPITNDARFHAVPPYKDYLLLRFWEGQDKSNSPMVFLRLSDEGIGFGAGWRSFGPSLSTYRAAVAGPPGADLAAILAALQRLPEAEVIGEELKRVPPEYASDHERADLLRRKGLGIRWQEPLPKAVTTARFAPWCARRLVRTAALHRWLRDNV